MVMDSLFTSNFFIDNRKALRERVGKGLIVLAGNGLLQRNGDATYKFRQDSSFWYLTGLELPDVVLVMDSGQEFLIVPGRDAVRQAFDGAVDVAALMERSGVAMVLEEREGWQRIRQLLKAADGQVATLLSPPPYVEHAGLYTNPSRSRLYDELIDAGAVAEMRDLRSELSLMRSVKQPVEIEALQKAIDITIDSLQDVASKGALQTYTTEYQAEAELTRAFKLKGAGGHAFEPIIVTGKRACTLHNLAMDGEIHNDELVQFDVGAEYGQYAADISRVYIAGTASERQRAVHQAVCDAQDYGLSLLKPGVMLADYEKKVSQFIGEKLIELGVIKAASDDEVRKYYPHAASHFLGLDVHDAGPYDKPLQSGMVVTCEPGIYIPEESIGVRIEDDVLITDEGNRVMSSRLGRALV